MSRQTSPETTLLPVTTERCDVCHKPVRVMAFKGTGLCSEICRKVKAGERIGALESRTVG